MNPKFSLLLGCLLFASSLFTQTFQRQINPFPIIIDGAELEIPFLGGFNKPNPQFVDWNEDGLTDLFIRDQDGRLQYFLNSGSADEPNFEFQTKAFQNLDVGQWFTFFDYDHDDDIDLMASPQSPDVTLFENVSDSLILSVSQLLDDSSVAVHGGQIVIPTIADIDGDGWEDLFVGGVSGAVTYYRNLGLTDGLPVYHLETNSFEDILIVWVPGRDDRHGANALEFYDIDDDEDLDLFWGDYYQPGLFFLENFGTSSDPDIPDSLMIDSYPQNEPVSSAGFNVPRLIDLNSDGEAELFVGVQSGIYGTDFVDNFWYYDVTVEGDFGLVTKNFFEQIDLISGTIPTLADIDSDGDLDLFVGNEFDASNSGWKGDVYFFENIGSAVSPQFELMDSSYFDEGMGNNMAPAFGDLDGDGDFDALVGDYNGEISFFINSGSSEEPSFIYQGKFLEIDLSGRATPALGDVDGDGDLDLYVGDKNGSVHVWSNEGDPANYNFVKISDDLFPGEDLGLEIALELADFDNDGDLDLLIGNQSGELYLANPSGSELHQLEQLPHSGLNLAPTIGDLDLDGKMDLIVGSNEGGLQYFSVEEQSVVNNEDFPIMTRLVSCYPNPFNNTAIFQLSSDVPADSRLIIYDILGRQVDLIQFSISEGVSSQISWNAENSSSGVYLWHLLSSESVNLDNGKLILLK
ncbi:MAG: FG-GAP-like repeat-containing protein [Candidatus Marinimicrobia bacterium]|nr:FG-GAP-like repeat-containing protein [Candidatus Neomarinimicrobiota bacterium]MDP6569425.1 FG-GAP-like repeat-containing protein [Candidatus Neomarinimicrobiota bacterium]MDP7025554.1 FG-GAP-like repeat-containing protein [Candidatus Neomarinimicrobiota bacterium]